jgi:acyl carrier protein
MEKREIITTIKDILRDSLKDTVAVEDIRDNTNLIEEIRLDSIQAMEILLQVEEKFDIMIDDEDLNKQLFSSMSSLSDYVMKKLQ